MRRSKCNQCELNSPLAAKEIAGQQEGGREGGREVGILGSSRVDRLAGDGVGPFTGQVAAAAAAATEMLQQKTRRAI